MNKIKNITAGLLAMLMMVGTSTSCSDFLDEKLDTQRTLEYFDTPEGIQELAVGLYYSLRFHFAYEWSFATTNYGVDEFRVGGDGSNQMWNSYDGNFTSLITAVNVNTAMAEDVWNNMYTNIYTANLLLKKAPVVLDAGSTLTTIQGEAYFMRGFNYFKLIKQYGGVPLQLEAIEGVVEREFTRADVSECAQQVIDDLEKAYELLPASVSTGKISKYAAAHFLAKAYLYRASEINDSWNSSTKSSDLTKALAYAQEVIDRHQLANTFEEIFHFTAPDGPNEQLDEIILAAQFTSNTAARGRYNNQVHLYFLSQYLNLPFMKRDIAGGREYQRLRTTDYAYDVYDRVNDSRFWKSFKTKYSVNVPGTDEETGQRYDYEDLSAIYIINNPGDSRFPNESAASSFVDQRTEKVVPSVFVRYYTDGTPVLSGNAYQHRFASLNKYIDGSRETVSLEMGNRDGILARVADTYLVAAEVLIKQGDYANALTYINRVRARGAYQDGEDRSFYCDGGSAYNLDANPTGYGAFGEYSSYINENSYYESNNIPVTTVASSLEVTNINSLPAVDEAIITQLGYTTDYDRMMCFLLNERSRELMGEFHRWEDLSRTKTLVARAKAYNPEAAANVQDYHCLRPIPQAFLDAIQKDGRALTSDEKKAMQNPGYTSE